MSPWPESRRIRREARFGDRIVRCYADRPRSVDAMVRAAVARGAEREALVRLCGELSLEDRVRFEPHLVLMDARGPLTPPPDIAGFARHSFSYPTRPPCPYRARTNIISPRALLSWISFAFSSAGW